MAAIEAPAVQTRKLAVGNSLRFVIPSDFAEGHRVQKCILDEVERVGYHANAAFAIKLALEEALINAMRHGNKMDPTKTVQVEATIDPQQAEIIIEDQGPGFCRASVPDPRADENLDRLHGRGILLMEAYMSQVQWSNGGRRVRMVRRNDDTAVNEL